MTGAGGLEWEALELLAAGLPAAGAEERLRALLRARELSWGELLEQAIRHRLIAALAVQVERLAVAPPLRIGEHLALVLRANRHRVRVLQEEACRLARRLEAAGVRFAAVKGAVLASSLYRDSGERMMADVDFLIPPAEGPQVERVLDDAGYVAGRYDAATRRVVHFSRRESIEFRLQPHHLPHRIKLLDDPLVDHVDVGFATHLAWTRAGFEVPLEPLLADAVAVPVAAGREELPALRPADELLLAALVLYKYASFAVYLEAGCDVSLAAFADLVRLWRHGVDPVVLRGRLADPQLRKTFTWSLEHTDRLFGTEILPRLGLAWEGSEDELHQVFFAGREVRIAPGGFRRRLYSKDRRLLFAAGEEMPR